MCGRYESWVYDDDLCAILELEKRGSADTFLKQGEVFPGTVQPVFYGSRVRMRAHLSTWGMPLCRPGDPEREDPGDPEEPLRETMTLEASLSPGSPRRRQTQTRAVPPKGRILINARAETADRKQRFAGAFRNEGSSRRGLMAASGYFEWNGGTKYRISDAAGELLFLAVLEEDSGELLRVNAGVPTVPVFSTAALPVPAEPLLLRHSGLSSEDPAAPAASADPGRRHVILTCPAVGEVSRIHDRLPLLLRREECALWLYDDDFARRRLSLGWTRPLNVVPA